MITNRKFNNLNYSTDEEKILFAALAVLTGVDEKQIKSGEYGSKASIHDVVDRLIEIANKTFHEEEYEEYQKALETKKNRNKKINNLLEDD
jgi:hypothetical protein